MKFRANPVDAVFLWMKIIKTGFKSYNHEKKQAGGNAYRQAQGIDESIAFITFQVSESSFKIIFKHGRSIVMNSGSMNMPV